MSGSEDPDHPTVLFLRPGPAPYDAALSRRFRLLKSWESPLPLSLFLAAHAASVRAVLVSSPFPVDAAVIAALPNLKFVMTTSAGVDHIDTEECARLGIAVCYAGTIFSRDVADYAVGLLIDVLRSVSASDRFVRGGLWPIEGEFPLGVRYSEEDHPRSSAFHIKWRSTFQFSFRIAKRFPFQLSGKRVGIVGLGNIGYLIAKRLEAFGCIISYNSREKKPSVPYPYFSNVCDLAAASDILIVCCALNSQTYHIINDEVMDALGKDGVVINVGRGALVDEKELVKRLVRGEIGGAGLDVFENEPGVPQELYQIENVVLSPHSAVSTVESVEDVLQLIIANFEAFFSNKPLPTPVAQKVE